MYQPESAAAGYCPSASAAPSLTPCRRGRLLRATTGLYSFWLLSYTYCMSRYFHNEQNIFAQHIGRHNIYEATKKSQGWEFAHSLIAPSLICSFCSNQMSDCGRFAPIAQDKWATVSESLLSLRGNERPWVNGSGRSRQMSDLEQFAQVAQRKWANEQFAKKILDKKI